MLATVEVLPRFPAPRPPGRPFDVPEDYRLLFARTRVPQVRLPAGIDVHLVGRYDDVRAVLSGPFSADSSHPGFPTARAGAKRPAGSSSGALSFLRMDGTDHRCYRRLTTAHFAVARLARLAPAIEESVTELLDAMAGGRTGRTTADLVTALALPLPTMVICHILGVPYADRDQFHRLVDVITRAPEMSREAYAGAVGELSGYIERLARSERANRGDDLLSDLTRAFDADPGLDPAQLKAIVLLLLVAGQETTAAMIALGALALMSHPEAAAALHDDTAARGAVEELLRYLSIAQWMPRVATEDAEFGDCRISAGEGVVVIPMLANRDPEVFADPDRMDLRRANAHRHLACGFGPHQCLGLQLARLELRIVFQALFRRFPGLRPALPATALSLRQNSAFIGLESLPVTW